MSIKRTLISHASIVSLVIAFAPTVANAQSNGLDEIIVTAQKRSENMQQVALSVSAVSGAKIESTGVDNLEDLSSYVPGLIISKGAVNTNIYIRGIGSGLNRAFEQSVGMYIDGIYMGRGRQYRSPFLDVERIEILRGPQGILFGKNTIAGAVSVITKTPTVGEGTNGYVSAIYEPEYNTKELVGAISGDLGENIAGRFVGKYKSSDGYVTNFTAGTDEPNIEEFSVRGTLVWEPSDDLSFTAKLGYSDYKVKGSNAIARVFKLIDDPAAGLDTVGFAAVNSGLADPSFNGGRDVWETWRNVGGVGSSVNPAFADFGRFPDQNNTTSLNGAITANWDKWGGTITSVTGWSEYDTEDGADVDFLPIQLLHREDEHSFNQFSQELRFASSTDGKFSYILGGYYDTQDLSVDGLLWVDGTIGGLTTPLTGGAASTLFGPLSGLPVSYNIWNRTGNFDQTAETIAVFAEGRYNVTDNLKLTAGLRFSSDTKTADKSLFLSSDTTGGPFTPANPDDGGAGTVLTAGWNGLFATLPHELSGSRKKTHVLPSAKLQWQATDDAMLYASYSEGFKSGGFNATDDVPFTGTTGLFFPPTSPNFGLYNQGTAIGFEFDDEKASSYEIGIKSELLNRHLRFNASAFFTKYSNLQVTSFQGTTFVVGNAANAEIKGLEFETEYKINDYVRVGGSLALLDFEYTDYNTAGCTAVQTAFINQSFLAAGGIAGGGLTSGPFTSGLCSTGQAITLTSRGFPNVNQNLSGQTSEYAPDYSGNIFAAFDYPINSTYAINANIDLNFTDNFFLDSDLDVDSIQNSYAKINLRLALNNKDSNWQFAVFGRNVTNEATFASSNDTPLITGSHTAYIQEPSVWGLSAKIEY